MSLDSVLILGPTGGFGQFILAELIKRRTEFKRIGAIVDTSRERSKAKTDVLNAFAAQGVELVEGSPTDRAVYAGKKPGFFVI